jgi:hypothetical protein
MKLCGIIHTDCALAGRVISFLRQVVDSVFEEFEQGPRASGDVHEIFNDFAEFTE